MTYLSGGSGGCSGLQLCQQGAKIGAREGPMEGRSGLLVARLKIHETVLEL